MAKNRKKQLYDIYFSLNNYLLSKIPSKAKEKTTGKEVLAGYIGFLWNDTNNTSAATRAECIGSVEWSYINSGSPAIFPESQSLLEKLFHSNYLFKDSFKLNFPFSCFQVAIPRGFEVEGTKIPPFLVNIGTLSELIDSKKVMFESADIEARNDHPEELLNSEERYIHIAISNGKKACGQNNYLQIRESMLPIAVKSRSVAEYNELIKQERQKDADNGYHENQLADLVKDNSANYKGSLIEFSILKVIAVLSIYLSATDRTYLKKGLPGSHITSVQLIDRPDKPLPYILRQTDTIKKLSNKNNPDEHYRIFHFRNLKAPQYYRGEYKDLIPGSRWVFVKDSLVNSKSKGYTPVQIGDGVNEELVADSSA